MFDVEMLYLARAARLPDRRSAVRWRDDGDSRSPVVSGSIKMGRDLLSIRWRHRQLAPRNAPEPSAAGVTPIDV